MFGFGLLCVLFLVLGVLCHCLLHLANPSADQQYIPDPPPPTVGACDARNYGYPRVQYRDLSVV